MDFRQALREVQARPQIYKTLVLDLTTARSEYEVPLSGNYLVVFDASDFSANVGIRFNESYADALTLTKGRGLRIPFYRIYITHAAQAGKTVTLIFGVSDTQIEALQQAEVTMSGLIDASGSVVALTEAVIEEATTPTFYNIDCTLAATQYSQALPAGTRKFTIKARGGDLKVCFTTGETATKYILLTDGQSLTEDQVKLTGKTLYFESPTAGADAEIVAWV